MKRFLSGIIFAIVLGISSTSMAAVGVLVDGVRIGAATDINIQGITTTTTGSIVTLNATSMDINSGTIDGTPIGASSPSTGAFTTLSVTSGLNVGGGFGACGASHISGNLSLYQGSLTITDSVLGNAIVLDDNTGNVTAQGIGTFASVSTTHLGVCGTTFLSGATTVFNADFWVTGDVAGGCHIFKVFSATGDCAIFGSLGIGGTKITMPGLLAGTDQANAGAGQGQFYADSDDDYTIKWGI